MFEFFNSLIGYIETIWDFVVSFFTSLTFAFEVTQSAITIPVALIGLLPSVLGASVSIFLAVYLVKFLLGR